MKHYEALTVKDEPVFTLEKETLSTENLPTGDVTFKVEYSGVNYKDALASIEKGGVIRQYPMVPGIDASGVVLDSQDPDFKMGQEIIVTSYGFGVSHPGGYSQIQKVPAEWVVPLPEGLTLKDAMKFGTAGFTAALAVQGIEEAGAKKDSRILITGASGGVGSIAIAMLKKLGFEHVIAVSRKDSAKNWLTDLGATEIVTPDSLIPEKPKALNKQNFDFVIDTVGGALASTLIPQIQYDGAMALCGNASGIKLDTTVLPFILRGVKLLGIDSVNTPMAKRQQIWQRLATDLNVADVLKVNELAFDELPATFEALLGGTHEGRSVVKIAVD
ncbi:YhdH/YhfP family quinone oxidoreductase [Enterococcus sp. HY326]|uniref:YhdH/YhfP family quinone oxidoreductase n=1 Tax=Enterococcus sp. HY326 TaxID=2971265 RepID=UPI002240BE03|nr:YhdH/YhfP family quinone oxidoreductase [Enterococcus sp. HY326]